MEKIVRLKFERATKNTVRYEEIVEGNQPPVIRTLYLQKWFLGDKQPVEILVTINTEPKQSR